VEKGKAVPHVSLEMGKHRNIPGTWKGVPTGGLGSSISAQKFHMSNPFREIEGKNGKAVSRKIQSKKHGREPSRGKSFTTFKRLREETPTLLRKSLTPL